MKRLLSLALTLIMLLSLAACGGKAEGDSLPVAGSSTETSGNNQAANPWIELDSSELEEKGFKFAVPNGSENVIYCWNEDDSLAEMQFTYNSVDYTARAKKATEFEDISGMEYGEYDYLNQAMSAENYDATGRYRIIVRDDPKDTVHIYLALSTDAAYMCSLTCVQEESWFFDGYSKVFQYILDPGSRNNNSKNTDQLLVEDVSFEADSSGSYQMLIKARNNGIPSFTDRELVNVVVYFQLLDTSGNGLPVNVSCIESLHELPNLSVGQSCWTTSSYSIDKTAVDAAECVQFTSYEFRYSQDSQGEWKQVKGSFSTPVSFYIKDIIPVGEEAFTIENLSVEFSDSLPHDVTSQGAYSAGLYNKGYDYSLRDSETYAHITFSITNLTKNDIVLNETSGEVVISLDFDDGFIYSTNGSNPSFMISGTNFSITCHTSQSSSERLGDEITLSPLVTYDIELYLRCAKAVAEQTDKPLVFSLSTNLPGYNQITINMR